MWKKRIDRHKGDLPALISILCYCFLYASARLLISPNLELDETEQFLNCSFFKLGYSGQAPLYTWIVWLTSFVLGKGLPTMIFIKYTLLALFYFSFYRIARFFWDKRESILVMSSLMLFTTYAYEANRDLSHTILISLIAVLSCLVYIRLLLKAETADYFLLGALTGLGILSKYNFVLFPAALLLSSLSTRQGRYIIFDKRIFITLLSSFLFLSPHLCWLIWTDNTSPFGAKIPRLDGFGAHPKPVLFFIKAYAEAITFISVTLLLFGKDLLKKRILPGVDRALDRVWPSIRALSVYGLGIPFISTLLISPGHFRSRWMAPIFFTLPLAFFSLFGFRIEEGRSRFFGYLCLLIAIGVLALRLFVGFFPDYAGKTERIHIPYGELSNRLSEALANKGIKDVRELPFIADQKDDTIAANIMIKMHAGKFIPLKELMAKPELQKDIRKKGGVLVHSISKREHFLPLFSKLYPASTFDILRAPYLHSQRFPPYEVGAIIIPPER